MQYKKNGQVNCNAVDLAVLHREAQKGKAWATPEAFLNAPHREIPYIPSVQIFVLLAFQPQDETDYSYDLCDICPAMMEFVHGNLEYVDEHFCKTAKARYLHYVKHIPIETVVASVAD